VLTRGGICVPPTVTYLPYRASGSTLTAVGRSQLLTRRPGTHSRILSGIQRAAQQTVLGVYLKRTCSRVTSASTALGVLNDCALYKSTHSHSLNVATEMSCSSIANCNSVQSSSSAANTLAGVIASVSATRGGRGTKQVLGKDVLTASTAFLAQM